MPSALEHGQAYRAVTLKYDAAIVNFSYFYLHGSKHSVVFVCLKMQYQTQLLQSF